MGVPLPGETALVIAGAYAGAGHLRIGIVIAVAAVASIAGGTGGYWIGRQGGRPFLERHSRWLHLNRRRLERIERFFAAHGSKTIFFGRFVSVVRAYIALFAGVSHMQFGRFTLFNTLASVIWGALFGGLGALFGANLALLERWVKLAGWGILLVVVLAGLVIALWSWIARHPSTVRAQRDRLLASPWVARLRARYPVQEQWLLARLRPGA
jgi:membrane protein DedA with SNARE-associated domain